MDFPFDKTMKLLHSMMDFRSQKHQLITSNVANIDTPGYTSKDLQFKGIIGEEMQKHLVKTDKRHFSGQFANAGSIDTITLAGSNRRRVTRDEDLYRTPAWGASAEEVIYAKGDGLYRLFLDTHQETRLSTRGDSSPDWAED